MRRNLPALIFAARRSFAAIRPRVLRHLIPDQVILDLSWACNIDCPICSLKASNPGAGFMRLDTVKRLRHVIPHLGGIGLSCCGESLLNRQFVEIVTYLRQLNPSVVISMSTNGMLLTPSIASELVRNGVNVVCVSVDGATPGTFETLRRGADFETVISNIKGLVAARETLKSPLEVRFVSVIQKDNVHELSAIVDLASSLGVNGIFVNGLEPYTEEMSRKVLYGQTTNLEYEKLFSEARTRADERGLYLELPSLAIVPYDSCFLATTPIINWEGDVYPCSPLTYERPFYYLGQTEIHPRVSFGNVNSQSLLHIWNSRDYRLFRKSASRGRLPEYCKKCLLMNRVVCKLPENA